MGRISVKARDQAGVGKETTERCSPCETAGAGGEPTEPAFARWVTRLVHDHRASLARVARGEGLPAEDAFDTVQEAFRAFLVRPDAAELVTRPEAARKLLVTLTRNLARNRRRLHSGARPHLSDPGVVEQLPDPAPSSEQVLQSAEQHQQLARCVGELVDAQRAVVILRMLDEVPGEDVARTLGIAPGHVAVLLHRAKANLATCMAAAETPAAVRPELASDLAHPHDDHDKTKGNRS
jgi:RNA polymerase sigma-70 factor (ECF subfamily)